MFTKKITCLLLAICCLPSVLFAQEKLKIKFGKVALQDFEVNSVLVDSSTNAVVLADMGKSVFMANASDLTFSLIFTQKKRIKIINKNGFDAATITIPLYVSNNKEEKLEDLDAVTYNTENGKLVQTKVEKSSVFTEKHSKNWIYKKFTFPALKEGSIIEYSYRVKSDFFFNLQSWTFQGQYPVLWSQYEAAIPEFFKYVTLSQGYGQFLVNKVERSNISFQFTEHIEREGGGLRGGAVTSGINNFKIDGTLDEHTWIMKDVPAIKEESYTTTVRNAVSKIEFQLNQVAFPNRLPTNYLDSWTKVASDLNENERFGLLIDRPNNWLDDDMNLLVKSGATPIEKAFKIYEFVKDNFSFNDEYGIYINSNLKDIFKNKNGSVADINMLLIAMLKSVKLNVSPVILSTRENGFTHEIYPLINRYNYVIAKLVIDNKIYYLDATAKQLSFGHLPTKVYNGQAREITNKMAQPVYFSSDSLKETNITSVFISNIDKGGLEGSLVQNMGVYTSQKFRNKMTKTLIDDYKKSVQQEYPEEIIISNIQVDSLKLLKEPVGLRYEMNFKAFAAEDIVYFDPMLGQAIKKNPFTAAERFYPVEMPYTIDEIYTLRMEIPLGYKIDELPKSVRIKFNEDEGMFEYLISVESNTIQMRTRLQLMKANYLNEDYQNLRDFYSYIVKKEAEQVVFKKIK